MENSKISVITVCYNAADTLEKTIQSVLGQTYPNIEYIIIDGGSTDGSVDIIRKYADRIAYWVSEPDGGIYEAMNKGIKVATGDYINFMNAGDIFYDSNVLLNISPVIDDGLDIVSGIALLDESNKCWKPFEEKKLCLMYFYLQGLCHQATFIKRILFNNCLYDEKLRIVSDSKFFIQKIILDGCTYVTSDVIVCRFEKGGISSNTVRQREEIEIVMHELFPERICRDYQRSAKYYSLIYVKIIRHIDNVLFKILSPVCKVVQMILG